MAVDLIVMPETVSVGFKGGPTFSTDKVVNANNQERRLQNFAVARHSYSWNLTNADAIDASSIIPLLRAFWYDRRGDLKSFLMKDWTDFQLIAEPIGVGDGSTAAFQAIKTYGTTNPYVRTIQYLKAGFVVKVDGVTKALTTDYTVNSTGLITFTGGSIPSVGQVPTLDGEFYVPVRFDGDFFDASLPEQPITIMNVDLKAIEVIP